MTERKPLWSIPIPVLGITGPYTSGKTLFLNTIAPGPETLNVDTEKSSESYAALGMKRLDVPSEMLRLKPNGYKPADTFTWFWDVIRAVPPGKFRVINLDVAEEIEAGLCDWVWENPLYFGRSKAQYVKMTGLYWGDVKGLWKRILADLASRCETFAFAVHLGTVWAGERPTNQKRPRGKSTLMELASLFLQLDRPKDAAGNLPALPSAEVLKTRLSACSIVDGKPFIRAALPPRLPVATPDAIREYLDRGGVDLANLAASERAPEKQFTEREQLELRLATAQAEIDAERLRIERVSSERTAAVETAAVETATVEATTEPAEASPAAASTAPVHSLADDGGTAPAVSPAPAPASADTPATPSSWPGPTTPSPGGVRSLAEEYFHLKGVPSEHRPAALAALLQRFNVADYKSITVAQSQTIQEFVAGLLRQAYADRGESAPFRYAGDRPPAGTSAP